MKKLILFIPVVFICASLYSQQWAGSSTTSGLVTREGMVVLGGSSLVGSWGGASSGVLEIQSNPGFFSFLALREQGSNATSFDIGFKANSHAALYANQVPMLFVTNGLERMRINTNGNIGFGTTLPTTKVEINSSVSNVSGLKFTQLSSSSITPVGNGKTLTVDATGNVILVTATGSDSDNWSLVGNAGTIDGTNFIGTTDNVPFNIRVNNIRAGRIDPIASNTFLGVGAGGNNFGQRNIAIGDRALGLNQGLFYNIAIGFNALNAGGGGLNTAIGSNSLSNNSFGGQNIAIGHNAMTNSNGGGLNTSVGVQSLLSNSTGSLNTAVGLLSLFSNRTGFYNSGFGVNANVTDPDQFNSGAFGAGALVNTSNKIRIGHTTVRVVEAQRFNSISDARFKFDIKADAVIGLEFINRLRPVVFNFNTLAMEDFLTHRIPDSLKHYYYDGFDFNGSTAIRRSGFIAQEVERAAGEVGYNFDGIHIPESLDDDYYTLSYGLFVVPLVKAVQELSTQNKTLKENMEAQAKINESLKKEMAELKTMVKASLSENKTGSIKISGEASKVQLFQNVPNPFNQSTIIRYSIPSDAKKAIIIISKLDGLKITEFDLTRNDSDIIEIPAGKLTPGTYTYALIVNGELIDSKKMILTHL